MKAWLERWRAQRQARALARRAIPEPLWRLTLARLPFLAQLPAPDQAELRRLCSLFLDEKEFTCTGGLVLRDDMALCVAAQACLPVLRFGLAPYQGFVGIVLHPDEVVARREVQDDDGVVHTYDEVLAGEAMDGGPVMLSWRDVADAAQGADDGYNLVIHEFVHVLDMGDGAADGMPPLPNAAAREAWLAVMVPAFQRFCDAVDQGVHTVLDPYGCEGPEEFFAVAAEAFFVNPLAFRRAHPAVYTLLSDYFQQHPAG